jgi:hypothetical protein
MNSNNLIIVNPKQTLLNKNTKINNQIIEKRKQNTYFNKIIGVNSNSSKINNANEKI